MAKIGVFYGSTTGITEEIVAGLKDKFTDYEVDLYNAGAASKEDLANYENIIFASSTWGLGELQDDWAEFIEVVKSTNLSGKNVALLGTGDQNMYPDTFVDAIGIIYNVAVEQGAEIVGTTATDDYDFDDSLAVVDGKFVGLVLDDQNHPELTEEKVAAWTVDLF